MSNLQRILQLAEQNKGVVTNAMVVEKGFARGSLKYLSDIGGLEKVSSGFVSFAGCLEGYILQLAEPL